MTSHKHTIGRAETPPVAGMPRQRFPPRNGGNRLMPLAIKAIERRLKGERPANSLEGAFFPDQRRVPEPYRGRLLAAKTAQEAFAALQPFGSTLPDWIVALDAFSFDASGRVIEATESADNFLNTLDNAARWQISGVLPVYCRRVADTAVAPQRWLGNRVAPWTICTEASGSEVIVDRANRPLCRRLANGSIEHLQPDHRFTPVCEAPIWQAGMTEDEEVSAIAAIVSACGLADEIERRCRVVILSRHRGGRPLPVVRN